jgi:hypothetical protein
MLFLSRPLKSWIIGLRIAAMALAAALVLGGCSAPRLLYNQGPEIAYWWLDGYADFDDAQAPRARRALAAWFAWHRRTQLPEYAALLERARTEVLHNTSAQRICAWIDLARDRFEVAYEHAVPLLVEAAGGFSPAQIEHIERRYAKADREFRDDFLQETREERMEASIARSVKRAKKFYGSVNDAQRALIVERLEASPFDADRWYAERQARQRDVLDALRTWHAEAQGGMQPTSTASAAPQARARTALLEIGRQLRRSPRAAYQDYEDRFVEYNCDFIARLHNASTPAQREAAAEKLLGWESDLRKLAGR